MTHGICERIQGSVLSGVNYSQGQCVKEDGTIPHECQREAVVRCQRKLCHVFFFTPERLFGKKKHYVA